MLNERQLKDLAQQRLVEAESRIVQLVEDKRGITERLDANCANQSVLVKAMTEKLEMAKYQFKTAQQQSEEAFQTKLALRKEIVQLEGTIKQLRDTNKVAENRARQAELANGDLQRRLELMTQTHNSALERVAGLERTKEELQREVQLQEQTPRSGLSGQCQSKFTLSFDHRSWA